MFAKRVIVIGWDGAGNFVREARTPNLDRLIARGSCTYEAQAVMPTISAQCWGSMLHGVSPLKHGLDNGIAASRAYPEQSPYPSVFRAVREARPAGELASFVCWKPINNGIIEQSAGVRFVSLGDDELAEAAAAHIRECSGLDLMFIQFDAPDMAGHKDGYGTAGQLQAIAETDGRTGKVIEAVAARGWTEETLFIVLSDHGGGGERPDSHGSSHPLDQTIFWACAGPGVRTGSAVPDSLTITDTAAVIVHALGLEAPSQWEAKLPEGLFSGTA
ncbi:alkaline phosphatase family protein [Paenibacillus sp. GYB004]|uniref:alkaline phosphatase family protein n=1 Tax=Paenibacillus sp. GYB004 TaxID=2994393 RepID=UPI002F96AFA7